MKKPVLTVGIPFYNAEKTLMPAIRSIFAQTYTDWELILVDDGSTDNSVKIATSINDPRVRFLEPDGKNRRLPARLNQIIKQARGKFIARMDADDLSYPDRFKRQIEFLESNQDIDVVGAGMCILNEAGKPVYKLGVPAEHDAIMKNKFKSVIIAHATIMAKAEWCKKHNYNETNIRNEDFELWLSAPENTKFANIEDSLYFCNEYAASSLSKYAKSKCTGARVVMNYGPSKIGFLRSFYYASRRYAQIANYAILRGVGLGNMLFRRRYADLTDFDYGCAVDNLKTIEKTKVPLIEDSSFLNDQD